MGTFQAKPGQFSLFKNDKKGNDSRPDYRGDGMSLDGTPIEVAAWIKQTVKGDKYMACKIQPKKKQQTSDDEPAF